jgi:hypothetical protein
MALKILRRPSASEAERADAMRELMLIASVSHPSVVQFKDYGWHQGRLWFVMPWYQGRPLDAVLGHGQQAVPMSRAEAKPIFVRIAQGLAAMHAVGIHHHDIKPENIFLADIAGFPGGLPVLLDLGIASRRGENPKGLTVEYASPETAAAMLGISGEPVGAASDVFSLALVLRNALDPELAAPSSSELLPTLHRRATEPVALSKQRDLRDLEPYFRRWLSLDPTERPSASQFADELAVLTAPQERREARLRILTRFGPVLALALALIALLVSQVQRQKTALNQQGQALEQERDEAEKLRELSASQLAAIEEQARTLGNERAQLEQALAVGHKLDKQLAAATKRNQQLDRKADKLSEERDALRAEADKLSAQRDALNRERDQLRAQLTSEREAAAREQRKLAGERDALASSARELTRERDALRSDARTLTAERDALARETRSLGAERDELVRETRRLTSERDGLGQERQRLLSEREALEMRNKAQLAEREALARDKAALEAQNERLSRQVETLRARLERERGGRGPARGAQTRADGSAAPDEPAP